jgi:PIF1-like helicase
LQSIIAKETLNAQQLIAFQIIAGEFFKYIEDKEKDVNKPTEANFKPYMRMLLSGPGGTGKTHVVNAVQQVMKTYGYQHSIRFLAPSGSAASLIDDMTIHKGLSIKVQKQGKGKGNRIAGDVAEDYSVLINIADCKSVREEFKDVILIMCDEVSLLSSQLMSNTDHALQYAKGNNDFFGGVIMIFAGDFYQYPPVFGSPLYSPIKDYAKSTEQELMKRLGRLAWKSVTEVIILEEQERMKNDPEYGEAVLRLRKRQCTADDVKLFNSRVVFSPDNPQGIDMSTDENKNATAIVATNLLRQAINMRKANANCPIHELTMCAALDTTSGKIVPQPSTSDLLNADVTKLGNEGALPGFIPMYIGMPVILRKKNISTELGITNRSQGILRSFSTAVCSSGFIYCTGAIVEFPSSKAALQNLPPKLFPLEPIKWSFSSNIKLQKDNNGEQIVKARIQRSQMPFEPGFASTGHSAQGKTLRNVLAWLHEGGFAAYVSASRPKSRNDLAIIQPVTLSDLNKPLPYDLIQETKQHEVLQHNTLIRHGFKTGGLLVVPDPEEEQNRKIIREKVIFNETDKNQGSNSDADSPTAKKRKQSQCDLIPYSCQWSSTDWSCSYDSIFTSYFCLYNQLHPDMRVIWSNKSPCTKLMANLFDQLQDNQTSSRMNNGRDQFRDYLFSCNNTMFPRSGPRLVDITEIIKLIDPHNYEQMILVCSCTTCGYNVQIPIAMTITYIPTPALWASNAVNLGLCVNAPCTTSETWVKILLQHALTNIGHNEAATILDHCTMHQLHCNQTIQQTICFENMLPTSWAIEINPELRPVTIPSLKLNLRTVQGEQQYHLRAIIYVGGQHFTARLFIGDTIWNYDSAKKKGRPYFNTNIMTCGEWNPEQLLQYDGRNMYLLIYGS